MEWDADADGETLEAVTGDEVRTAGDFFNEETTFRDKVNGGGYGIVVHVDEKQKAKIIDDVKVAVCPECGNIEMYLEDLTDLKD